MVGAADACGAAGKRSYGLIGAGARGQGLAKDRSAGAQSRNDPLWHCIARLRYGKGKAEIRVAEAELGIPSRRQSKDRHRNASEKLRQALQRLGPACRRYAREKRENAAHRISSDAISKGNDMRFDAEALLSTASAKKCCAFRRGGIA